MKTLFSDDEERLRHIFENQIYGFAPTEVIYRIILAFVLGFNGKLKINDHNIHQCDASQHVKEEHHIRSQIEFLRDLKLSDLIILKYH
ncbi:MAG: hypothetical protein MJZ03_01960 [archaeon]|nr:hypothetical protein [archaeon]